MASFWADFFWSWSLTVFLFTIITTFLATIWWYFVKDEKSPNDQAESTSIKDKLESDSSAEIKILEVDILEDIREVLLNEDGNSVPAALHDKALLRPKYKLWQEEDANVLKNFLQKLASEKDGLETILVNATQPLIRHLKGKNNQSVNIAEVMQLHALNIVYSVAFGTYFDIDDERIIGVKNELEAIFKLWPNFSPNCQQTFETESQDFKNVKGEFMTRMKQILLRCQIIEHVHQPTLMEYLIDHKGEENTDNDIAEYLLVYFLCGYSSLEKFFSSAALLLSENPEIQEKVFNNLDNEISYTELPEKQPFIQATLQEVLRIIKPVSFAIRETSNNKDETPAHCSFTRVHLDAALDGVKYWESPETLDPSRFLDKNGTIVPKDAYLPFSIGVRSCPGKVLVELASLIFLTSVIKSFLLSKPKLPEDSDEKSEKTSSFLVCVSKRDQDVIEEK